MCSNLSLLFTAPPPLRGGLPDLDSIFKMFESPTPPGALFNVIFPLYSPFFVDCN